MKNLIKQIFFQDNILKNEKDILNWLKYNDENYKVNIQNHVYKIIDIHEQNLINDIIKEDGLSHDYFEKIKLQGDKYLLSIGSDFKIRYRNLKTIPIKLYKINGDFNCAHNQLISLKKCFNIFKAILIVQIIKKNH